MKKPDRSSGSPHDRGSADKYYGRAYNPHHYLFFNGVRHTVYRTGMSEAEIAEYTLGWDEEEGRKDWGDD